jgi:hypothetical protein
MITLIGSGSSPGGANEGLALIASRSQFRNLLRFGPLDRGTQPGGLSAFVPSLKRDIIPPLHE